MSKLSVKVVAIALASAALSLAQTGQLRAGAAKVDISPTSDMFPLRSGQDYGSLHDPIYARALVIDNGTSKAAMISVDATSLPNGDDLIKAITSELKIPADHLILNATHDHNAPTGGGGRGGPEAAAAIARYYDIMKKGIVEAAREANSKLQPARVGFAKGKAYINTNRDEKLGEGYHMGYAPDGPSDKTVAVMSITSTTGAPIAIYSNYAVHAVVMFRTKTKDDKVQISGDLSGWTSNYVEDRIKNVVALWTPGAAGDQNPVFMANYNQDGPDVIQEGPAGWSILDVESRRLGEEIVRVAKSIQNTTDRAVIWGKATSVTCPGQRRAEPPKPGVPNSGYLAPPPSTVKMVDDAPFTIPLNLLMINDIALAGVSGEVFTEIGEHLKRDAPFDRTMVVTLGPNGVGYIPTDKAYLLPSEKAVGNRLKPGCAEPAMVSAFVGMMNEYLKATPR